MAYGAIDFTKYNSANQADQNSMALAAGYTGREDLANNRGSQSSTGSGGGFGGDIQSAIKFATQQQQEAIKPAVEQLQSTVAPLQKRYDDLLASIKGNQTTDVNKQTVITNNELGKRGILGSSTLAGQEVQNAVQPINASYAGITANTGIAREKDLSAITQAIAQLKSGAAQQGISTGTGIYNTQAQLAATEEQNKIANELATKKQSGANNIIVEQGNRRLLVNKTTGEIIKDYGTGSTGGGSNYYDNSGSGSQRYTLVN